jgi:hypothetical protein
MDRAVMKLRNNFKSIEDGGFKFAITFITACISVLFIIHKYAENNLIPFSSRDYII